MVHLKPSWKKALLHIMHLWERSSPTFTISPPCSLRHCSAFLTSSLCYCLNFFWKKEVMSVSFITLGVGCYSLWTVLFSKIFLLASMGTGALNSMLWGKFFLNAVDLERMVHILANDLPELRAITASVSTLCYASVVGCSYSKCYKDYR